MVSYTESQHLFGLQPLPSLGQRGVPSLHQHLNCRPSTPLSAVMVQYYCTSKAGMVGMDVMDSRDLLDPTDQLEFLVQREKREIQGYSHKGLLDNKVGAVL